MGIVQTPTIGSGQAGDDPFGPAQELVDAVVAAVDVHRSEEVDRVRVVLDSFGLGEAFVSELRLSGVPSLCNGDCWELY